MKTVLVIDDDHVTKSFVEKFVHDVDVEQVYRIPDDVSTLMRYDALVVDGNGIGNDNYSKGIDLLMDYDKPEGQSVVYYSGNGVYGKKREELEKRGVAVVTKGSNPEKLSLAIKFAMYKTKGE